MAFVPYASEGNTGVPSGESVDFMLDHFIFRLVGGITGPEGSNPPLPLTLPLPLPLKLPALPNPPFNPPGITGNKSTF